MVRHFAYTSEFEEKALSVISRLFRLNYVEKDTSLLQLF